MFLPFAQSFTAGRIALALLILLTSLLFRYSCAHPSAFLSSRYLPLYIVQFPYPIVFLVRLQCMESSKTMRNVSKVFAHDPSHSSYTMPPPQIFIFMFYLKFLLIYSVTPLGYSAKLTFSNNCTDHVWPGILPGSSIKPSTTGFSLRPGEDKVISVETNWTGKVWGRTLCTQNSTTGNFNCVTGDCRSNNLECSVYGEPPVTLGEFALNATNGLDYYDVSLVDGYNLPMTITPHGGSRGRCVNIGCASDLNSQCPPDLAIPRGQGDVVGCKSACSAYVEDKYCCVGNWTGDACQRNSYTAFFKIACPTAYSYAYDKRNTTFTCAGADYLILFCPSPTTGLGQVQQHISPTSSPKSGNDSQVIPPLNSPNQTLTNFSSKGRTIGVDAKKVRIISPLAAGLVFLCLGVSFCICKKKQKKAKKLSSLLKGSSHVKVQKEYLDLPLFDLRTISFATNNFASTNKLGKGGFGTVYKGILKDGQEIAVKRLSQTSRQGLNEFKNEVTYIAKLQHRNLVKLLGCCIETDEIMLIYEFMPNKSLDYFIFDATLSRILDWPKRYNIINGIARGLQYLHQDSRLRIIHRDLKVDNVLLDQDMNPKISDFGLARCFGEDQTEANTKKVMGTHGYMSPEYQVDGIYSVKSDVFSFGVMVLEIVSGQRNRGFTHPDHQLNLLGHAWRLHQEGRSLELIAEPAKVSCSQSEILKTIQVALLCVQRSPEDRPSMSSVVLMMSGEGSLAQPKQPGFFTERELVEANVPPSQSNFRPFSLNALSLSSLDPR
ncbi:hypothetical protein K2173_003787 [Erythroxylum novogranatense]|uniref:non-specific serine/threonine protein kinase n=1 Tax=Erythroxylum novogranatense TaxID=1862640 RepID=A0AAV8SJK7_9ROSI|nr:hypothetical protein K2173_003787 [Erythroxylum novogranatense]